jgi:dienelactone hydrolase
MKPLLVLLVCVFVAASASAGVTTKSVAYEHGGTKFEGVLAYDDSTPPAAAKRPGVLVIPEWWGVNDYVKSRAQQLAQMGYVAFVADMYGGGVSTTEAKKAQELAGPLMGKPVMAERAQAGLDQLLRSGLVDEKKVAAIGFCFGGSACQMLAYSGAPVAGIVSFHGGLVQPSPEALKKIPARFLMLNGAIDPMVKPEDVTAFMKALDSAHVDYQFINYSEALHAFSNPGATKLAEENNMTAMVGYNEAAARRSWAHMKLFFDELFQ